MKNQLWVEKYRPKTISEYVFVDDRLKEQVDGKKFVIYGDFPKHSKFTFPTYVPPDANWARIHINGLHVLAGHVVKNIFYIVFMDNSHSFWEME